jgi:hypothetical protein
VIGLGTVGYLSSTQQYSFSTGILYTSSINFIDGCNNSIYPMIVSSGALLFNGFNFSGGQGGGGVGQLTAGTGISLTPTSGQGANVRIDASFDFSPSLTSTVIGLGTVGYISTAQLTSTSKGLYDQIQSGGSGITNDNLVSTVVGLGTIGYVSTSALVNLVSTANLVNLVSTTYLTSQLTSTVVGLGTIGYVSSASLINLVSTANLINLVSTANLINLVSTANLANLVSTANLFDLISSPNLVNLVSTSYLLNGIEFSSLSNETARLNFSSLFVNNTPILFDQYGNLSLSFQTL